MRSRTGRNEDGFPPLPPAGRRPGRPAPAGSGPGRAFAAYYLLRPELVLLFADHLLKEGAPLRRGLGMTLLAGLIGAVVAPRVTLGLGGWIRHLPASSRSHRLQAAAAVLTAELPILVPLAALAFLLPPDKNGAGAAWAAAVGIFASAFLMALYLMPVRQPFWASGLGLAACILAGSGELLWLAAAAPAAWLADRATGPFLGRPKDGPPFVPTDLRSGRLRIPLVPARVWIQDPVAASPPGSLHRMGGPLPWQQPARTRARPGSGPAGGRQRHGRSPGRRRGDAGSEAARLAVEPVPSARITAASSGGRDIPFASRGRGFGGIRLLLPGCPAGRRPPAL